MRKKLARSLFKSHLPATSMSLVSLDRRAQLTMPLFGSYLTSIRDKDLVSSRGRTIGNGFCSSWFHFTVFFFFVKDGRDCMRGVFGALWIHKSPFIRSLSMPTFLFTHHSVPLSLLLHLWSCFVQRRPPWWLTSFKSVTSTLEPETAERGFVLFFSFRLSITLHQKS